MVYRSSWISVWIMPVLVGGFIYVMSINSFHRQTVQNNEAMLMQMYDLAEKAFNHVSNIAYEVSADHYLNEYIAAKGTHQETAWFLPAQ